MEIVFLIVVFGIVAAILLSGFGALGMGILWLVQLGVTVYAVSVANRRKHPHFIPIMLAGVASLVFLPIVTTPAIIAWACYDPETREFVFPWSEEARQHEAALGESRGHETASLDTRNSGVSGDEEETRRR